MEWRAKVELFEEIRREYEFGVETIAGTAKKLGVHRRMVREAIQSAVPAARKKTERPRWKLSAAVEFVDRILEGDRESPSEAAAHGPPNLGADSERVAGVQDRRAYRECKGTQSSRSTAVGQLQRGSEQVMTVDIDPPAAVTRLVIGPWLQQSISVLLIDPDENEGEVRKLSHWSPEELTRFAAAKRLTYIGDNFGASSVVSDFTFTKLRGEKQVFERARLTTVETDFGEFVGSAQQRITPDGHRPEMFRGVQGRSLELLYRGRAPLKQLPPSRNIPENPSPSSSRQLPRLERHGRRLRQR